MRRIHFHHALLALGLSGSVGHARAGAVRTNDGAASTQGAAPSGARAGAPADEPAPAASRPLVDGGCTWPCYVHTFAGFGVGKGLRLNNPFRLQTQLGSSPQSLSATATTLDVEVAALLGNPSGWHHGLALASAIALEGVPQQVVVPSYATALPLGPRFWWRGRLGVALVTQPDFNAGLELGTQVVALVRAGLGAYLGVVYARYWGAATDQTQATSIPIVAAQVGATLIYEVLP